MIVHLVRFNKEHAFRPTSFAVPTVEDLAFLIQVHSMLLPQLALGGGGYLKLLPHPFLMALEDLKIEAGPGEELFACHVDLTNAFWSLRLPAHLRGAFRVQIDGNVYGFNCLPFGWQYSPIMCQTVLGYIVASLGFSNVLVLHYLDDFLLVGYSKPRVREASAKLCDALTRAGAIISVKSVLEPTQEIMWLGKWLSFSRTSGGVQPHSLGWIALAGLWLRAAVLPMTCKQAQRILGRFTWAIRPSVGCMPMAGWWMFCVWGPNWVQNCPLNLLQSLCHCLVMALEGWYGAICHCLVALFCS